MQIVTAENRRTGSLEYVSSPMPEPAALELAAFLRS
jgi:hypothetical protein